MKKDDKAYIVAISSSEVELFDAKNLVTALDKVDGIRAAYFITSEFK